MMLNGLEPVAQPGYGGWMGCEYKPSANTNAGLGWPQPYLTG